MTKFLPLTFLALALAGCGTPHLAAAPATRLAMVSAQAAPAGVEQAIRGSIERRIADYKVSLQAVQVQAPKGAIYAFTADEQVSGLGGARRFHLAGQYDAASKAVTVATRTQF